MNKLKTAVIGLGRIGWQFHIPSILQHNGFELTAVVDPLAERLAEAQKEFAVKGYSDYIELLDNEKLDLVVVASPTPFHAQHSIAAMERGIDVFLDKPMTPSLEEADQIINVMEKTGRKLMVYQPARIRDNLQTIKSILEKDLIGSVYMIKRCDTSIFMRRNDWQSLKKNGGGMLNNYGAHIIDEMLYLIGSPASKISCSLRKIASLGDADDVVKAVVETESGVIIDIDINMATAIPFPIFIVMGTKGSVTLERDADYNEQFRIRYFKDDGLSNLELKQDMAAMGRSYSNFEKIQWHEEIIPVTPQNINYYDKCYEYYALDKAPFAKIHETREVMRVIDACRKDAGWQDT